MADQNPIPESTIPPKVTPFAKTQGIPPAPSAGQVSSTTIRVQPLGGAADASTPGSPRRTSRIPLTGAIPPMMAAAPDGAPRTIRIKPVGPQPGANPIPDGPRPPTEAQVQAAKSKTSRISLDAAIGAAEAAGVQAAPDAPKTIRLKRPTEMPTVKVAIVPPPSAAAVSAHATSSIPSLATVSAKATAPIPPMNVLMAPPPPASQTARIPDTAVASDNAPITQKRTIRVKRPAAMVISGGGGEAAADEGAGVAGAPAVAVPIAPDTAHWAFNFAAVLTILLTLALLVVFSSQIFGPNASLTELSVWATGPDLPLPGTVSGN